MKAAAKSVIAPRTAAVSDLTVTSTGVGLAFCRVTVRPSTTLLSVLLADVMAMPLIVRSALAALLVRCMAELAAVASKPSADRPVAALPSSLASLALRRKAFSAPVSRDRMLRRAPLASVTMLASTPALAMLILSRRPASVLSASPTVTVMALLPVLRLKSAAGLPSP